MGLLLKMKIVKDKETYSEMLVGRDVGKINFSHFLYDSFFQYVYHLRFSLASHGYVSFSGCVLCTELNFYSSLLHV